MPAEIGAGNDNTVVSSHRRKRSVHHRGRQMRRLPVSNDKQHAVIQLHLRRNCVFNVHAYREHGRIIQLYVFKKIYLIFEIVVKSLSGQTEQSGHVASTGDERILVVACAASASDRSCDTCPNDMGIGPVVDPARLTTSQAGIRSAQATTVRTLH